MIGFAGDPHKEPHPFNTDSCHFRSLTDWFSKGHFGGLWRTQAMGTFHQAPLTDNWASGTAFRLHYETAQYRGWRVTVVGQFGYALASSDLSGVDELTGQRARFELHMFDIEDPTNRKDFDRLENLTLNKRWKTGEVIMGRYSFESPFVNGQDTRLKANAFSGFTAHQWLGKNKRSKVTGAFVRGISPRGTIKWFDLGNSLGLLDNGLRPDGQSANYKHTVSTKGMIIAGWQYEHQGAAAEVWHYHVDNLFMHTYGRMTHDLGKNNHWNFGVEALTQQKLASGGSTNYDSRYYYNDDAAVLFGSRLRHQRKKVGYEVASLSSIGNGTYLFPREWGRERFFTSVPRARVEGLGKFTEVSVQFDATVEETYEFIVTLAYLDVPDIHQAQHNKYSLVDHYLVNGEVRIHGSGFLKNADFRFITAAHYPAGDGFSPNDLYYKAEFVHFSMQLDVHF